MTLVWLVQSEVGDIRSNVMSGATVHDPVGGVLKCSSDVVGTRVPLSEEA